ncbi:cell division ATP-binding protein FtsE [Paenibacillus radicis (ex Xue et al. 2023)]|uniref:ATP-binding cassette domain-containing protein n=1 Tax=Paenibacillus radicis (ex Xue et al. 2023) TaxID=2972489 RepID=A0ABT1YEQ2_9BACL|nr:ATP-binding cassette domain-containing protein [Paenibacillus radicis (ex Xue et al. 2023)]MCR8631672.1 ATP-binding cassette domain-containing protein [Paenibacillus radicis (ex Xue et al. 2023)]
MIRISNLTKSYGGRIVLNGLNLELQTGEFAYLQGRSGSGKSTLLKLLYRDLADYTGEIEIGGSLIGDIPKYHLRRKIGVIFQSFELLERKTVLENVALTGEVLGQSREHIEKQAFRLLDRVGLKGKEEMLPHQLSGGEQQRVAIARALLSRPALLLADEPTGNLDPETAVQMLALLRELHAEENMSMLVVTHSERLIERFPARTLLMEDGRIQGA